MLINVFYIILAALGFSFLVFIHELGHYFVAKRNGMKIEVFSIGFGKPLFSWKRGDVKWQVCPILLGGFVRIYGQQKEDGKELHEIDGGFYKKTPWQRIKVLFAGPFVNIAFALFAFALIWVSGGRTGSFQAHTSVIGLVDPASKLYEKGVRPGDRITHINEVPFSGMKDLMIAAMLDQGSVEIAGEHIDYIKGIETPFSYTVEPYVDTRFLGGEVKTLGILSPAQFLLLDHLHHGERSALPKISPMHKSGIKYGDRLIWANGEILFSEAQLSRIINSNQAFLLIEREGIRQFVNVPRVFVRDMKLRNSDKMEMADWQHEAGLTGKIDDIAFLPYHFSNRGVVEKPVSFLNDELNQTTDEALVSGDRIISVDGVKVDSIYDVLTTMQKRHIQFIVQNDSLHTPMNWQIADFRFANNAEWNNLEQVIATMKQGYPIDNRGRMRLLKPVAPVSRLQFHGADATNKEAVLAEKEVLAAEAKRIEEIKDPKKRRLALKMHEQRSRLLILGIVLQDQPVVYNPSPLALFESALGEVWLTFSSLFTGALSPKHLAGPIGILRIVKHGIGVGFQEAMYWLGLISLNLGLLNLLPLPVLDGGHILFSVVEWITGKQMKMKTMEKLLIPFIILFIGVFLYVTFHDVLRLIG